MNFGNFHFSTHRHQTHTPARSVSTSFSGKFIVAKSFSIEIKSILCCPYWTIDRENLCCNKLVICNWVFGWFFERHTHTQKEKIVGKFIIEMKNFNDDNRKLHRAKVELLENWNNRLKLIENKIFKPKAIKLI